MAGERILIVEDEVITGMDVRGMLRIFGYEPYGPVATGKAAVESALALRPDVILMDVTLKGPMNGIQAAEAIRSQYRCPVIYLTGSSDQVGAASAKLTEPFGLVLKPIDEDELHRAIETALYSRKTTPSWPSHDVPSAMRERTTVGEAEDEPIITEYRTA